MKTHRYLIALVVLVAILLVAFSLTRPPSAIAPTTASSTVTKAGATGAQAVYMTPSGNVQAPDTSLKTYVPIVTQSAGTPAKFIYSPASTTNDIRVTSPLPGAVVSAAKAIKISGEARGNWFFEATFPVMLTDADGKLITSGTATAGGNWMTTDFVSFLGNINFIKQPAGSRGFIILKKDNPSDMRQFDASVEIPVVFQ